MLSYISTQELINLKLTELFKLHGELLSNNDLSREKTFKIRILSNVVLNQFKEYLELCILNEGYLPEVILGDFDNVLNDSFLINEGEVVFVIIEASTLHNSAFIENSTNELNELGLQDSIKHELSSILKNCEKAKFTFINKLSLTPYDSIFLTESKIAMIDGLNKLLNVQCTDNMKIVDIERIYSRLGTTLTFSDRYLKTHSAPYTFEFIKANYYLMQPYLLRILGKRKKVIAVDCDNTLWGGVVGEDGAEGILLDVHFLWVQRMLKSLSDSGVLLVAVSKNNLQDVQEVWDTRDEMILKESDFTAIRVNWLPKSQNIIDLAETLNLGLDSFLFIDDSDFEINEVRTSIPYVETFKVPKTPWTYRIELSRVLNQFQIDKVSAEDLNRKGLYKAEVGRKQEQVAFDDYNLYLASLNLNLTVYHNFGQHINRMAQLTQKTNQFNLTTNRYLESEIENFLSSEKHTLFSFAVKDRFGDCGIVGLVILETIDRKVIIDSFLMSCRVLGRNIEYGIFSTIVKYSMKIGAEVIEASYIKTAKNSQVKDLFENLGMTIIEKTEYSNHYRLETINGGFNKLENLEIIEYGE